MTETTIKKKRSLKETIRLILLYTTYKHRFTKYEMVFEGFIGEDWILLPIFFFVHDAFFKDWSFSFYFLKFYFSFEFFNMTHLWRRNRYYGSDLK